jgi:diguanylate cyclase (GGDEF)-like protein/PAS domain S-box-containing protein
MPAPAKFRTLALALLIVAGLSIGVYWHRLLASSDRLRSEAHEQHALMASRLAAAAGTQTEALVRSLDSVLTHLRSDFLSQPEHFTTSLQAVMEGLPEGAVPQIGVIDAEGFLAASSLGTPERIYLGDREHFRVHAAGGYGDRLYVSTPVLGRRSGTWSVQLSRPMQKGGKFRGAIVASISPEYLAAQLAKFHLGENDTIAILRQDGIYLSRNPRLLEYMGKAVLPGRPFIGPDAADQGIFRSTASHETVERTYAWQRLGDLPLIAVTGLADTDFFDPIEAEIRRNLVRNGVGSGLVVLLAATLAVMLLRFGRQQNELLAAANVYRSLFMKNTSVKLLIDPSNGSIVDANPAACDFYGYGREQLLNMKAGDINILSPEEVQAEMAMAREEKRTYFNFSHRLASGEIREVEVYSGPVAIEGKVLLHSIVHDVTERRRLEKRLKASEALFRTLFEILPEGILLIDPDGTINTTNDAATRILGTDREHLNLRPYELFYPDGRPVPPEDYPSRRCVREGTAIGQTLYAVGTGESRRWISVSSSQMPCGPDGEPMGMALSITDVTRLLELEESLRISQSVFNATTEGILVTDADSVVISVNPAFSQITGYQAEQVVGHKPSILASGVHDQAFYRDMYEALSRQGCWEGEITNRKPDGSLYVLWIRITAVKDGDGHINRYVSLLSDITVRKRQQEELWRQANYDGLTGLPNRILFQDRLQQAMAQAMRRQGRGAVLFIDLDRFKSVNDTHGHLAGDELLRQTATRIGACLREEDTVARVGGDEFLVLLPNLPNHDVVYGVADKILATLNLPFALGSAEVRIGASIGVAVFPDQATTANELIDVADTAMYSAKSARRGIIRNWHADPESGGDHDKIGDLVPPAANS